MRDVYAAQFLLTGEDAFARARDAIGAWCKAHYEGKDLPEFVGDGTHALSQTDHLEWAEPTVEGDATTAWSLTWRHVDNEDPGLGWRVLAQLVDMRGSVRFTFRLTQESLEPLIRPAIEVPGRPRIVRELARVHGGVADGRPLSGPPWTVGSDDVGDLVTMIQDPRRRLPVVVVSVSPDLGGPVTDPLLLADQLVAIAHVASFTSGPPSFGLTQRLGKQLSVFDGAVRVYWPGFTLDDDPYLHRLWLGRTVESIDARSLYRGRPIGFARHLLGLIGDIAALRVPPDPEVRRLRREADARLRAAERADWERLSTAIPDEFAEEFDRKSRRIEELELAAEIADEERDALEREIARLVRSFADVRAAVGVERGDLENGDAQPTSIREALEQLASRESASVAVLPEAFDAADETRYRHLDRAAAAIRAIGDVARGWHDNTLGMSFDAAFQERGFELRSVSPIAQGRHPNEYGRTFEGRRILLSPHLALGDGGSTDSIFRIYWHLDEPDRRFVIGHAGRHLDDSTT